MTQPSDQWTRQEPTFKRQQEWLRRLNRAEIDAVVAYYRISGVYIVYSEQACYPLFVLSRRSSPIRIT